MDRIEFKNIRINENAVMEVHKNGAFDVRCGKDYVRVNLKRHEVEQLINFLRGSLTDD